MKAITFETIEDGKYKYLIHLDEGDVVKFYGLPCEVMSPVTIGTNTKPTAELFRLL